MNREKVASELLKIARDLTADSDVLKEDVSRLQIEFPFHGVVEVLDDAYRIEAAYNYDEETPVKVLRAFKKTYPIWLKYDKLVKGYFRKDSRFKNAYQKSQEAMRMFKILESGRLLDWKGGFVTLLARLKRAHESLYHVR